MVMVAPEVCDKFVTHIRAFVLDTGSHQNADLTRNAARVAYEGDELSVRSDRGCRRTLKRTEQESRFGVHEHVGVFKSAQAPFLEGRRKARHGEAEVMVRVTRVYIGAVRSLDVNESVVVLKCIQSEIEIIGGIVGFQRVLG